MKSIISTVRKFVRKQGYDLVRHKELSEWLEYHEVDVVLDIGANDGRYAMEMREAGWAGKIVSFEPNPEAYNRLAARMSHDPAW
jgi:precorrin-6B methylase 2